MMGVGTSAPRPSWAPLRYSVCRGAVVTQLGQVDGRKLSLALVSVEWIVDLN